MTSDLPEFLKHFPLENPPVVSDYQKLKDMVAKYKKMPTDTPKERMARLEYLQEIAKVEKNLPKIQK